MNFAGKSVAVTGGANGIGLAIAKKMVEAGASVRIFDLPPEHPERVAAEIGARSFEADVTDRASLECAWKAAFGAEEIPHVAVACAGIGQTSPLGETTAELWNRTIAVNLTGVFHTVQIAAQCMVRARSGAIVLVASTNSFEGEANLTAYNASKAGVLGILHTAANEFGPYGIRVNAVCPGLIRTRLTASSFSDPSVLSEYFRHIPLGRGGEPDEVAQAVLFLASDLASYITGATLLVDGGQMASKFGTWAAPGDRFDGQKWTRG